MAIFYSPSLRGFFDPKIHDPMPEDAVRVAAKRHAELLAAQEAGGEIVPDTKGRPAIRRPGAEELRTALLAQVKREASRRIEAISPVWRQLNDQREPSEAGTRRFALIDAVRSASTLIEDQLDATPVKALESFPVRDNPLWPQIDRGSD